MKTTLLYLWDQLRSGYWFVPACMCLAAAVLAYSLPQVEFALRQMGYVAPGWLQTTHDSAATTLAAIFSAMITVIGTVFSITIVTLSLTSQQLGPRLLRQFMSDKTTQVTLGTFIATAGYCLLSLRIIDRNVVDRIPHVPVAFGVGFALISMGVLIHFIHHVAVHIQAPNVVAAVALELDITIERLFPQQIGETMEIPPAESADSLGKPTAHIVARREGYIQAIDGDNLIGLCRKHQLIVKMMKSPGDFISPGVELLDVWQMDADAVEAEIGDQDTARGELPEEITEEINELFIVGPVRTPRQDIKCAMDELVEVAVRSLSPGINDPFTAINCIDRLGAALNKVTERKLPSPFRYDEDKHLRVIARVVPFDELIDSTVNPIRRYGADSVQVLFRLLEVLTELARRATRRSDLEAIARHAKLVQECGARFDSAYDARCVSKKYDVFQIRLTSRITAAEMQGNTGE